MHGKEALMSLRMEAPEMREKLEKLLKRRDDYFAITDVERNIYRKEFEVMQAEIVRLKLHLDIYHDELDIIEVEIDYSKDDRSVIYQILEEAWQRREINWVKKKYFQDRAIYVGMLMKDIQDMQNEWLKDVCMMHQLKREGYIQCPWSTKLHEKGCDNETVKPDSKKCK